MELGVPSFRNAAVKE